MGTDNSEIQLLEGWGWSKGNMVWEVQVVKPQDNKLLSSNNSVFDPEPHVTHQTSIHPTATAGKAWFWSEIFGFISPRKAKIVFKNVQSSRFWWQWQADGT